MIRLCQLPPQIIHNLDVPSVSASQISTLLLRGREVEVVEDVDVEVEVEVEVEDLERSFLLGNSSGPESTNCGAPHRLP